jgi:putative phage-type endonuclease
MQIVDTVDQGTDEWHELRNGLVTASKFKDAIAAGAGKTRKSYIYSLAAQTVTGKAEETFSSQYMEWGNETEPQARAMYEFDTGYTVDEVSFIRLDGHKVGCSPDGLIDDDGLVEFKCPKTTTQIETFLSGKMPTGHKPQVQGQMWVANREWCDFVSFDPRISGAASFFKVRVIRDEEYIKELSEKIFKFEEELAVIINLLKGE